MTIIYYLLKMVMFILYYLYSNTISSNGVIESIPKSPIAVIVGLVIFLQATILYGGNEELGWRGTMQVILQENFHRQ